ncbi:alpha/beta hydrolase family protein [Bradyrhizobium erythrophlei]|jgi:dienelactone hydrolase|uniref:Dienelactone hydrolase n=1 Tax=Bradyrhizobium erythrophlei TaxID=1437360 RepID=A0A1M7TU07_9BRAD|nr:Dienelactone hydrolase [Bradyrhizobium erythrophlei]
MQPFQGCRTPWFRGFFVVILLAIAPAAMAQSPFGPVSAEAEPNRAQAWLVPSPDPHVASHAVLFRPPGEGPFRLAVIAHASTQNVIYRAQMRQPEYRSLAAFLVARGFAVLVPERLGHGATGGDYLEDQRGCDEADYLHSGRATREAISVAFNYLRGQPFIRRDEAVIIGHSAGGWGALALANADPAEISSIIVFAPGRGGQANGLPNQICAPHTLLAAANEFGHGAHIPVSWLVAANDSYFPPDFSRKLADAFRAGGGKVDFRQLAAYDGEGHWMAETDNGVKLVAGELDRLLKAPSAAGSKKP